MRLRECAPVSVAAWLAAALASLALGAPAFAPPAFAAWPTNSTTSVPVCVEPHEQYLPKSVPDGLGGAYVVWIDQRAGASVYDEDLYAQHLLASGVTDPVWPATGLAVCTATMVQQSQVIVADGAGGAIIAWQDLRDSVDFHIYAQRLIRTGADPAWPVNGRAICTAAGAQYTPALVADGAGGAIITWQDLRNGGESAHDIYAQHVRMNGTVDPAWPLNGTALCTDPGDQLLTSIATDGAGGAIVAWNDPRGGGGDGNAMFAQHVLAAGSVDANWPVDGQVLSAGVADYQYSSVMTADGTGGAIVAWMDLISGTYEQIYAAHVLASGVADPAWPEGGQALGSSVAYQLLPVIASDGAGGAIVAWQETRGPGWDIYAQRVLADGTAAPGWPADGRGLCSQADVQTRPSIAADGSGGAFVAWEDERNPAGSDIYMARVLAGGTLAPGWTLDGSAVCTAAGLQAVSSIVPDLWGGAIAVWTDFRAGNPDVEAQRVDANGVLGPPPAGVGDVPRALELSFAPPVPNPARTSTHLRFVTARPAPARLEVFDAAGRRVRELYAGRLDPGAHDVAWDLRTAGGVDAGAGVYFARLAIDGRSLSQRIVVSR